MDVFLIPVGPDRYELYCEQPAAADEPIQLERPGVIGRLRQKFGGMVREAEERQRGAVVDEGPKSWVARLQDRAMAWAAERIAEQRLLWNLRTETTAVALHPDLMTSDQVLTLVRRSLQRDSERHRRWMLINAVLLVVTFVPLAALFLLIPGVANLPSLYFAFRTVGHFLSMRGAAHGLHGVTWSARPCPPLGELCALAGLEGHERDARLNDVATQLRLQNLPKFFDRISIRHS